MTADVFSVTKNGNGLHIQAINRELTQVYQDFFLGLWIADLFYSFALTPAKLAFLAFYWRIFQVPSIKLPIKMITTVVLCWLVVRASFSIDTLVVHDHWELIRILDYHYHFPL